MTKSTNPVRRISVACAARLLVFPVFALIAAPANAAPCAGFIDVDDASTFCANVTWIKNRGITLGCTANQYCPDAPVTRLQMAAFMNRLGNVVHQQGGNAFGAAAVLGSSDYQAVEIRVDNHRVMIYDPTPTGIPNLLGGHHSNTVDAGSAGQTVGGGYGNSAGNASATIAGGALNNAGGEFSAIGGGNENTASGEGTTVVGGGRNTASADYAAIGGGFFNTASGGFAAIPGGLQNKAIGDFTFVAGRNGTAAEHGMFVWSDSRTLEFNPALYRAPGQSKDTFNVRATGVGGVWFVTGINASGVPTWACYAQNGSGWTCASDRNLKRNLERLDGEAVLAKLTAMPIYQWQPKAGPNADIKHFGPMAQDFHSAFGLGDSDKSIGFQDADGVALAAIQGLHALAKRQAKAIDRQVKAIEALRAELAVQRNALAESRPALARVVANDRASGEVPQARASEATPTRWNRKVTLRRPELGAKP